MEKIHSLEIKPQYRTIERYIIPPLVEDSFTGRRRSHKRNPAGMKEPKNNISNVRQNIDRELLSHLPRVWLTNDGAVEAAAGVFTLLR